MSHDLFKRAEELQEQVLPLEIMGHKVSAEYHRRRHMVFGGLATVLTTPIGTSVFTSLVSQFGLNGKAVKLENPFAGWGGPIIFYAVLILSTLTPIIAALRTFMHDSEDFASHWASVECYSEVLSRMNMFLAKYADSSPDALNEYGEIMDKCNSVLGRSLTITERAYEKAKKLQKAQKLELAK